MPDTPMSPDPRKEDSAPPDFSPWTWSREMPPVPEEDPGAVRRYRRRLVLFVLLMILLTVWFQVHLEPYVTQGVFLSGTLTLWGLWKILQSWFAWGTKGQTSEAARKWLAQPVAGELLALGLILIVLLLIGTSSIYLHFAGARSGEDGYRVEVLNREHPFVEDGLQVTSAQRQAGRPFFLRWRPVPLVFRIADRPGWEPLERTFFPGQALHLNVPGDFTRTRLLLLRLIPGKGFLGGELTRAGDPVPSGTTLRLRIGDREHVLPDLRLQSVVLGAESKELSWALGDADRPLFHQELDGYLGRIGMPPDGKPGYFDAWEGSPRVVPGVRLAKGAKIQLWIQQGLGQSVRIPDIEVEHDSGVQTRFLEIPLE